jgi:hypothetical protein
LLESRNSFFPLGLSVNFVWVLCCKSWFLLELVISFARVFEHRSCNFFYFFFGGGEGAQFVNNVVSSAHRADEILLLKKFLMQFTYLS